MIHIQDAVCGYQSKKGKHIVLEGVTFTVEKGEIICILGANGIGKTTLFRTILGSIPLLGGSIMLSGKEMKHMKRVEIAKKIAYVPQYHTPPFPFSVLEVVSMGRVAHLGLFSSPSSRDMKVAGQALEELEIGHLAERTYTKLSGGERQMVLIARALAQDAEFLMMDEPASSLDYGNQIRILRRMKALSQKGIGILFTSHNPDHAFLAANQTAMIKGKQEFCIGNTTQIITKEQLQKIYGIETDIVQSTSPKGENVKSVVAYID